jgi:hypothetical protein
MLQKSASEQAVRVAAKKTREQDAALAMQEYQAERSAVLARTARLRALRLAKEADVVAAGKTVGRRQGSS